MSTNILKSVILFGSRNIYRTNHSFTGTSPSNLFRRTAGKRPVVLVLSRGFVFIVAYMVLYERVVRQRTVELGQPLPFHLKFRLVILLCLRQTQSSPQRTTYRHFRTLFSMLKRIRSNQTLLNPRNALNSNRKQSMNNTVEPPTTSSDSNSSPVSGDTNFCILKAIWTAKNPVFFFPSNFFCHFEIRAPRAIN